LNFLFWNVAGKVGNATLADLAVSQGVDVLVLAEYADSAPDLLRTLASRGGNYFHVPKIACLRISVFSVIEPTAFAHKDETDYYSIMELRKPGAERLLMGLTHLPSKLHQETQDQFVMAMQFRHAVEKVERDTGNGNTVLVGDFNMNPFELGMVTANGLHSLSCLKTTSRRFRTVKSRQYSFFYNPSWNLLGDRNGTPGTHFYGGSGDTEYFWHTFDQVLLRPDLALRFDKHSLRILTMAGTTSLVGNSGRPNLSDHLPIAFSLNLDPTAIEAGESRDQLMA
jgi:hypothetical protein